MLNLRSLWINDEWDDYQKHYTDAELTRLYPDRSSLLKQNHDVEAMQVGNAEAQWKAKPDFSPVFVPPALSGTRVWQFSRTKNSMLEDSCGHPRLHFWPGRIVHGSLVPRECDRLEALRLGFETGNDELLHSNVVRRQFARSVISFPISRDLLGTKIRLVIAAKQIAPLMNDVTLDIDQFKVTTFSS